MTGETPFGQCPACLVRLGLEAVRSRAERSSAVPVVSSQVVSGWFADLEVGELLGIGGTGAVYRAYQPGLEREIALKVIPLDDDEPLAGQRLLREAQLLARLQHPRIVAVYDVRQVERFFCLLLEYVPGGSLRQRLASGPLPLDEAMQLVEQVCEGLAFAHRQGIVHRDIKPENILLDAAGMVKIADFGIAKMVAAEGFPSPRLTHSGQVLGSANYMAPEQFKGASDPDPRSDLYALGVVFYEALTGHLPAIDYEPPSRGQRGNRQVDALVLRLLRREPGQRPASADVVREQLLQIRSTGNRRLWPWVAVGLAAALGGLLLWQRGEHRGAPGTQVATSRLAALHRSLNRSYVDLKNASATYESRHDEYSVSGAIDGVRHSAGWSVQGQQDRPQAAVFQTVAPLTAEQLLFELENDGGGYLGFKPRRFRISYTTAPDPDVTRTNIEWVPVRPQEVRTTDAASEAAVETDGCTIRVSGSANVPDDYIVLAAGDYRGVTGFRLDLLCGPSGILSFVDDVRGDVHLTEFGVLAYPPPAPPVPTDVVPLARTEASFDLAGPLHHSSELIDGAMRGTSFWLVKDEAAGQDQAVAAFPAEPLVADDLVFELMHNTSAWFHKAGRFRLSYTTDPQPALASAKVHWTWIVPQQVRFEPPGLTATWRDDGTIDVEPSQAVPQCNYRIFAHGPFAGATAFRLELLTGIEGTLGTSPERVFALSEWRIIRPGVSAP
ncbi:MAG: serine/threonine protein kinase [Pirellulales bacterium]|nr:serine/threonine protein kinase [Pirellulales bacterium]